MRRTYELKLKLVKMIKTREILKGFRKKHPDELGGVKGHFLREEVNFVQNQLQKYQNLGENARHQKTRLT